MSRKANYQDELRNLGFKQAYSIWSPDEDEQLLRLYQQENLSKLEIAQKLRRTLGSINSRLKKHGIFENNIANEFATFLREGINPITGEILADDSAWRHPSIMEDIEHYARSTKQTAVKSDAKNKPLSTCYELPPLEEGIKLGRHIVDQSDFFRFEDLVSFTPRTSYSSLTFQKILESGVDERRNENRANGRLLNHGFPICEEEIQLIKKMSVGGYSILQLANYFQRNQASISKILE